eukprot:15455995-Alexandrium_andersonii.AAC.1
MVCLPACRSPPARLPAHLLTCLRTCLPPCARPPAWPKACPPLCLVLAWGRWGVGVTHSSARSSTECAVVHGSA